MIKCMNKECDNYNQELEEHIEICPLCKQQTENIQGSVDKRAKLGPIVSIVAIVGVIVAMLPSMIGFYLGIIIMVGCVVFSIIIRQKVAIITSILAAGAMFGILWYFGFFERLF